MFFWLEAEAKARSLEVDLRAGRESESLPDSAPRLRLSFLLGVLVLFGFGVGAAAAPSDAAPFV